MKGVGRILIGSFMHYYVAIATVLIIGWLPALHQY